MSDFFKSPDDLILDFGPLRTSDMECFEDQSPDTSLALNGEDIQRITPRHHKIARLFALGHLTQAEIAERVNMTQARISVLLSMPSIQMLVDKYAKEVENEDLADLAKLKVLRDMTLEAVEESVLNGTLRGGDLIRVMDSLLNRTGLPESKEVNINNTQTNLVDVLKLQKEHWKDQAPAIEQEAIDVELIEESIPKPLEIEEFINELFEKEGK